MRDRAVRVELGLSQDFAAAAARVSRGTIDKYEVSRDAVRTPARRLRCEWFYREARAFLERVNAGPPG